MKNVRVINVDDIQLNREFRAQMEGRFGEGIMDMQSSPETVRFLLMIEGDRVVAAQKYIALPDYPEQMNASCLETARDSNGHGFGKKLFCAMFDYAAANNIKTVVISPYTLGGRKHLLTQEAAIRAKHSGRVTLAYEQGC